MKKITLFIVLGTLLSCAGASAQTANTDSLKLVSKISSNQLKLAQLQNEVDQKTQNKTDAGIRAQNSANDNTEAAKKLSDNPDDKKLARQANNRASDAKNDARSSRKEARRLINLNKDIADLKIKINKDQVKLDKFTGITSQPLN